MWKKIVFGMLAVITIIIIGFFYKIGLYNKVDVVEITSKEKIILGKKYKGSLEDVAFKNLFREVGRMQESGAIEGKVCGAYFNNPEKEEDGKVDAIIGIWVKDSTQKKPEGFTYSSLPEREVVQGHMEANIVVLFSKTFENIFDYAEDKNIKLTDRHFEWFESHEEIFIEVEKE